MSEERINLELLGARVLTLTAEVRDLQHRFTATESRFFGIGEPVHGDGGSPERHRGPPWRPWRTGMSSMLSLIVRIAERLDGGKSMIDEGSPSAFAAATSG